MNDIVQLSLLAWEPVFIAWEQILGPKLYPVAIYPDWRKSQKEAVEKVCHDEKTVVSTNLSNTQHKARHVISVDLERVLLSPTAIYTEKRPDGPWAPRPELFKRFVDSTLFW